LMSRMSALRPSGDTVQRVLRPSGVEMKAVARRKAAYGSSGQSRALKP
jgi:hypothetical protein